MAETGPKGEWRVRVPMGFLDARRTPMSDQARVMLLILEGYARTEPDCFPGNEELAAMAGKKIRAVQRTLDELEAGGWVERMFAPGIRPDRMGIRLIRRVDPDLARSEGAGCEAADGMQKKTPSACQKRHAKHAKKDMPGVSKTTPELGLRNKTQLTTTTGGGSSCPGSQQEEAAVCEAQAAFDGEAEAVAFQVRKAIAGGVQPGWIASAIATTKARRKDWGFFLGVLRTYVEQGGPIGGLKAGPTAVDWGPEFDELERETDRAGDRAPREQADTSASLREAEDADRLAADRALLASHGLAVPGSTFRTIHEAAKLRGSLWTVSHQEDP